MTKGKDSSCLCINCGGTNACRRGAKAAIKSIDELKSNFDFTQALCLPGTSVDPKSSSIHDNGVDVNDNDNVSVSSNSDTDAEEDNDGASDADEDEDDDGTNDVEKDKRAAAKLLRLYDVVSTATKYDACVACVPCLKSGKLEDAKFSCVNGECPTCGFDKIWSKGVRRRILRREFDTDKKEWVEKLNPNSDG